MEGKKNLCAMIPAELHAMIMAEKEQLELNTLAEYVERIFTEHFEGGQISMKAERTLAVQIPAELFERLKDYLAAHNLKQKQFLVQLIENALDEIRKRNNQTSQEATGTPAASLILSGGDQRSISILITCLQKRRCGCGSCGTSASSVWGFFSLSWH